MTHSSNGVRRRRLGYTAVAAVSLAALGVAGCGTQSGQSNSGNKAGTVSQASPAAKGTANIAYAGSLQLANSKDVGPAFEKATGYHYQGRGGGSFAVANLIKSDEIQADAFESVGTAPIVALGTGDAKWAVGFASSPLVLAYSSNSPYAKQLDAIRTGKEPLTKLFTLMAEPNFHLGRTNPETDPQGQAFILMMKLAQKELHLKPGAADKILGGIDNGKQIFSEEGILSRLQAGQLDASSAFLSEAIQRNLPYIKLPDTINLGNPQDAALYKSVSLKLKSGKVVTGSPLELYITTPSGAPNKSAGNAFVAFVLSKQGKALYQKNGYALTPDKIWGSKGDIPSSIRSELTTP